MSVFRVTMIAAMAVFLAVLTGAITIEKDTPQPGGHHQGDTPPFERRVPTHIVRPGIDLGFWKIPDESFRTTLQRFEPVHAVFGKCGAPVCLVNFSPGGKLGDFWDAGRAILENTDAFVVINGPCISGCAVFADMARPKVCITTKASFYFHQAYARKEIEENGEKIIVFDNFENPPHAPDIDAWVKERNGYPQVIYSLGNFLRMSFADAKNFWPVCELRPPLPRPDPRRAR